MKARVAHSISLFLCDDPHCHRVHVELYDNGGRTFAVAALPTDENEFMAEFMECVSDAFKTKLANA